MPINYESRKSFFQKSESEVILSSIKARLMPLLYAYFLFAVCSGKAKVFGIIF